MSSPDLLHSIISDQSQKDPEAPAILTVSGQALTYQQLIGHLRKTALNLNQLGFRPGDCLAVVLPNGPEMASAFLAVSAVCACAPLNPQYPFEEYKFSLSDLHVKGLVVAPRVDHPACKAAVELGIPILSLHPDPHLAGIFTFTSDLPVIESITEPILAGLDDIALILHTSGTTSRPKIVPLTHRNIFHSVKNIAETYRLTPADRCLNMMPLFHIHGLIGALSASLVAGSSIVCAPGFLPDQVLRWLSDLEPTWYTAVPTIHQSILEQVRRQPEIIEKVHLRFIRSCSSALAPQVAEALESVFATPVLEAYGMTEATHQMASNPLPPSPRKFGSVGQATGTSQISIMDEVGKPLPPGVVGEVCIRGENVMSGYENNPEANATSFTNGWLRTGDRGLLDKDGYLFLQGRIKELINRGGEKISPREIDEVLLSHPAVQQAVAFAIPHPLLGEDVGAAIVLREGKTVSMQELRQFTALKLADYKIPRQVVFLREIPKGPTGKIQRIGMAEKLKEELEKSKAQETTGPSEPHTSLEKDIISIWQIVLDTPNIGIQDDFLSLGGDSIQAARILTQINERFGMELQASDIFTASTVASMASLVKLKIDEDAVHD
jgi:acyl-CoA synthetase (AMP-forming)/AMP-acid ligase II/acyl carrier protein